MGIVVRCTPCCSCSDHDVCQAARLAIVISIILRAAKSSYARSGSTNTSIPDFPTDVKKALEDPCVYSNSLRTMALSNLRYAGVLVCILFISDVRCAIEAKCPNTERLKSLRCAVIGSGAVGITLAGCRPPVCPLTCHRVRTMLAIDRERNSC